MKEKTKFFILVSVFAALYFIPFRNQIVSNALLESFFMLKEYARQHVLLSFVYAC